MEQKGDGIKAIIAVSATTRITFRIIIRLALVEGASSPLK